MELTFDLSSIVSRDIRVLSPNNYLELYNDPSREPWELFFKPHQLEKVFQSSFSVTSSQLREFLTETFGIPFELDNNSNRNRLNEMIKDIAPTQRGKRTKLNFYQYRNLILSDKFNKFILSKHDEWNIQRVDYRYIEAPAETKQMLDIVSYRFRQKSPLVYKFDSRDDVYSTTKNQIIEWFLQDVDRWANNEIK